MADGILFCIPLALLLKVRAIAASTRRRLIFVFATSIFTLIASVIYNTFVFGAIHWKLFYMVGLCSHMEVSWLKIISRNDSSFFISSQVTVSLIVCNFSVILPIFYRRFSSAPDVDTEQSGYAKTYWGSPRHTAGGGTTAGRSNAGISTGIVVTTGIDQAYDIELPSRDTKEALPMNSEEPAYSNHGPASESNKKVNEIGF